jgi:hypothetical protein
MRTSFRGAAKRRARNPSASSPSPFLSLRVQTNFLNHFNLIWVVQSVREKQIASHRPQISGISRVVPPRKRGVRVVTNVECGMRWTLRRRARKSIAGRPTVSDRKRARRATQEAYGKAVWSWHPLLVLSPRRCNESNRSCCAANSLDDGDKQEFVAEESPV